MIMAGSTDKALDTEMAYTNWQDSCRDLYSIDRCCRRAVGHDNEHASGFGVNRIRWQSDGGYTLSHRTL